MRASRTSCFWLTSMLLAGLFLFSPSIQAQDVETRTKRKVKRRVDRKVDETIDDGIDSAIDALGDIFGGKKKKDKKPKEEPTASKPGETNGNSESVGTSDDQVSVTISDAEPDPNVEASPFVGSYLMKMIQYKKGKMDKDSPALVGYHIDKYRFAMKVERENDEEVSTIIYDRQTRKITTKMEDGRKKTATITKMPNITITVDASEMEGTEATVTATGRTKEILGYTCKEYMIETEEAVSHVWFAEDLHIELGKSLDMVQVKGANKQVGYMDYATLYGLSGTWLEVHTESKKDQTSQDIFIQDLVIGKLNSTVFSTEGFEVTDISNLNIFWQLSRLQKA